MAGRRALVVFCGGEGLPPSPTIIDRLAAWLFARLRPNFRHCFALVPEGETRWLWIDPLTTGLDVTLISATRPDLDAWAARIGATMIDATIRRDGHVLGFGPITCVTAVKALLGLRSAAVTPYQLYLALTKETDMGGFFAPDKPSAPAVDTSAQDKQIANMEEQNARLTRQNTARRRMLLGKGGTGAATLRFDGTLSDQGTADTLGG